MYWVYVLYSSQHRKIYIGYTSNLEQRLLSHIYLSHKGYTRKYRPWTLAFTEEYMEKRDAMEREKYLKSGMGREAVWKRLRSLGYEK